MNTEQMEHVKTGQGFVAGLDQPRSAIPMVLRLYGYSDDDYSNVDEMYELLSRYYSRVVTCVNFTGERVFACVIPEQLLDKKIEEKYFSDYLWDVKGVVPCVKLETELENLKDGVQLIKEIPDLDNRLDRAAERNIFAVKISSMIKADNEEGIQKIVDQQMELAAGISARGFVPILEPEVFFRAENKEEAEYMLSSALKKAFKTLGEDDRVMLSVMLPKEEDNYYSFVKNPNVLRVMAISAAMPRGIATYELSKNRKVVSGFNRGFLEGFSKNLEDNVFRNVVGEAITALSKASS